MNVVNLSDYQQFSSEKMKKNNMFQTPRFFCDIYCFEPGQEQKGHIHGEQDKVYLVLEGQGTFQVGSEKQVLGPGQGTMAPAGEEHGVKNHTGQRLKVLSVRVAESFVKNGGVGWRLIDLLCSRNARSRTPLVGRAQWKINQSPSLRDEEQRA